MTSPQLAKNSPLKQIGFGISKRTFAIDGLKKYVLKAPRLYEGDIGYRTNSSSEEIMLDYENQRMVERVVNKNNLHVVIPKTHLIEICKSSQEGSNCRNLLLTETVPVNRYINLNKTDYDKMHPQACRLISTAGLCDINFKQFHTLPDGGVRVATHNLAVLDSAEGLKLAPYDFDCMHESDFIKRVTLRINGCGLGPH